MRGKRATPRLLAVVNKVAKRTTLTSLRGARRRFPALSRVVKEYFRGEIVPRGIRAYPRDYLRHEIIEDRINKAQFKKRARYIRHSWRRERDGRDDLKMRSRFWLRRVSSRERCVYSGKFLLYRHKAKGEYWRTLHSKKHFVINVRIGPC